MENLTNRIFKSALPKRIGNHQVTGAALAGLAEAYVAAINNGAVPVISTAWQVILFMWLLVDPNHVYDGSNTLNVALNAFSSSGV